MINDRLCPWHHNRSRDDRADRVRDLSGHPDPTFI